MEFIHQLSEYELLKRYCNYGFDTVRRNSYDKKLIKT